MVVFLSPVKIVLKSLYVVGEKDETVGRVKNGQKDF